MAKEIAIAGQSTMLAVTERMSVAQQLGETMAKSGWFKGITSSTGTIIAITMMSENLTPVQFKQRWHVTQDGTMMRVTNSVLGDFKMAGGKYEYIRADREVCEMVFEKDGIKFTSKVTMEEMLQTKHPYAGKATNYKTPNGKYLKDNWAEHPDDMLFARCCGKGLRRVWPEGMGGIYLKDEYEPESEFAQLKEAKAINSDELKNRIAKMSGQATQDTTAASPEIVMSDDITICPIPGKNCFGIKWEDMESDRLMNVLKLDAAKFPMFTDAHREEVKRILDQREQEIINQAEAEARAEAEAVNQGE